MGFNVKWFVVPASAARDVEDENGPKLFRLPLPPAFVSLGVWINSIRIASHFDCPLCLHKWGGGRIKREDFRRGLPGWRGFGNLMNVIQRDKFDDEALRLYGPF